MTFYRKKSCPKCAQIQEALQELSLAHKVVIVQRRDELSGLLPSDVKLPVLHDEGELYQGADAIMAHMEKLAAFKERWYGYQSDACYCDEDEEEL